MALVLAIPCPSFDVNTSLAGSSLSPIESGWHLICIELPAIEGHIYPKQILMPLLMNIMINMIYFLKEEIQMSLRNMFWTFASLQCPTTTLRSIPIRVTIWPYSLSPCAAWFSFIKSISIVLFSNEWRSGMDLQRNYKFWFCTGSQDLYGDECLANVAEHTTFGAGCIYLFLK